MVCPIFNRDVKGVLGVFNLHIHVFANELQVFIAHKRTWKQAQFCEHLKTIANTHDQLSLLSFLN